MVPFFVYLAAAVAVGAQTFRAMTWAVWGAPTSPLQFIALVGSALLFVAANVALFRVRAGATLALIGALGCWTMYVFVIGHLVIDLPRSALQAIPSALLVLATVHAVGASALTWFGAGPAWAFTPATPMQRRLTVICFAILATATAGVCYFRFAGQVSCPELPQCTGRKLGRYDMFL